MALKRSRSRSSSTTTTKEDVEGDGDDDNVGGDGDGDGDGDFVGENEEAEVVRAVENKSKRRRIADSDSDSSAASSSSAHSSTHQSTHHPSTTTAASSSDRLSPLSDELLIRILHALPLSSVLVCQLVSRRFRQLAGDAQVWKALYWARWVRPRVRMLRGEREIGGFERGGRRWLGDEGMGGTGRRSQDGAGGGRRKDDGGEGRRRTKDGADEGGKRRWLDEGGKRRGRSMAQVVRGTDWKARYKLRHNWSRGAAEVREIGLGLGMGMDTAFDEGEDEMGEDSKGKSVLMARLMDDGVVTVDVTEGLRAWDLKRMECFAQCSLAESNQNTLGLESVPTCLCVDSGPASGSDTTIVVGFQDGHFEIWKLGSDVHEGKGTFSKQYQSGALKTGERGLGHSVQLSAVAYAHPHLLTITAEHVLALYVFDREQTAGDELPSMLSTAEETQKSDLTQLESYTNIEQRVKESNALAPRLLTSLKSHTCWPPLCLSIRSTPQTVIASIAYALPTYLSGWSVGLQELHLSRSGTILRSRLASAIEQGFRSLLSSSAPSTPPLSQTLRPSTPETGDSSSRSRNRSGRQTHPTSLSYSHPYLLAGNRDNTLSLYLVTSNNDELKISKSTTLWGHTSSISGAHVGGRGKAVSISAKGDELRVWELEGGLGKKVVQERSVLVRRDAGSFQDIEGNDIGRKGTEQENVQRSHSGHKGGWVGFNDEVVIVLKEDGQDGQALVVYDFT